MILGRITCSSVLCVVSQLMQEETCPYNYISIIALLLHQLCHVLHHLSYM